ncbi:MAG: 30S ribosomal protein S20 [Bacteriovoracaceae bacterium]|nr:30S ribosomal protein S20 [Bacteriovoracaceae bacterium]
MPHHKSAKKRVRQTEKRTERNKSQNSTVKSFTKKLRAAISEKNKSEATKLLPIVQGFLDKLAKKSIIKSKNSARRNSRYASQVAKL